MIAPRSVSNVLQSTGKSRGNGHSSFYYTRHTHTDAGQSSKFKSNKWQQFLDIFASNQYFINNHKAVVDFVDISFTLTLEQ